MGQSLFHTQKIIVRRCYIGPKIHIRFYITFILILKHHCKWTNFTHTKCSDLSQNYLYLLYFYLAWGFAWWNVEHERAGLRAMRFHSGIKMMAVHYQGFPSSENFVNSPIRHLSPFLDQGLSPAEVRPRNLKDLNTFLYQIWLLLSSKVP